MTPHAYENNNNNINGIYMINMGLWNHPTSSFINSKMANNRNIDSCNGSSCSMITTTGITRNLEQPKKGTYTLTHI